MQALARRAGPVLLGIVLVGCVPLARTGGVLEGQLAPAIEGPLSDGQSQRLSDYRGKVVLLAFWHGN